MIGEFSKEAITDGGQGSDDRPGSGSSLTNKRIARQCHMRADSARGSVLAIKNSSSVQSL